MLGQCGMVSGALKGDAGAVGEPCFGYAHVGNNAVDEAGCDGELAAEMLAQIGGVHAETARERGL